MIIIVAKTKINFKILLIEMGLHAIQPYPNVAFHWNMYILGTQVTYSLNMILFSLSIIRLYVVIKVIKYWNLYTNDKSQRIFKFFKNKFLNKFFYKVSLKAYGFNAVIIIFCVVLYIGALVFKVFENYQANQGGFSYISLSVYG